MAGRAEQENSKQQPGDYVKTRAYAAGAFFYTDIFHDEILSKQQSGKMRQPDSPLFLPSREAQSVL